MSNDATASCTSAKTNALPSTDDENFAKLPGVNVAVMGSLLLHSQKTIASSVLLTKYFPFGPNATLLDRLSIRLTSRCVFTSQMPEVESLLTAATYLLSGEKITDSAPSSGMVATRSRLARSHSLNGLLQ